MRWLCKCGNRFESGGSGDGQMPNGKCPLCHRTDAVRVTKDLLKMIDTKLSEGGHIVHVPSHYDYSNIDHSGGKIPCRRPRS